MTLTLATLTALFVPARAVIAVSVLVCRQIAILQRRSSIPLDCAAELSVERYRPMFRLLEEDDIRFLRSQPGAPPALVNRLRKQRCQLFRGYLRHLERDFQQASDALILVMVQSQSDRNDLISALIRSRLKFTTGVFLVRCRLLLYRWNVGREPVARLVKLFEGLHLELRTLVPHTQGAGV